jgi:hypothetical protein
LKSFQKGSTCENLSQKGLKTKKTEGQVGAWSTFHEVNLPLCYVLTAKQLRKKWSYKKSPECVAVEIFVEIPFLTLS